MGGARVIRVLPARLKQLQPFSGANVSGYSGSALGSISEAIDREREKLDTSAAPRSARCKPDDPWEAILTESDMRLDFAALLEAVDEPPAPVVTHRRRVA